MYHDFASSADFRQVEAFIRANVPSDDIMFCDAPGKKIIVKPEHHSIIADFIRSSIK